VRGLNAGQILTWAVLPLLAAGQACGQTYPDKTIRIVTSEAGGNGDFNARLMAQGLAAALGHSVIVENRRGTIVAPETVAHASPDGYTLLASGSNVWIGPLLEKMPYDPIKDFAPISSTTSSPNVLVVHPSLPVKSVKELIAYTKAHPGEINYSASGTGSPSQIAGELFKSMTGIKMVGVPYKSAGSALTDMISGQVQMMFASTSSVAPHVKSGRLRALAVTSARPSALFPDLPTVAATLPGYESGSLQGIWAPAKAAQSVVHKLNQEIAHILAAPDVKERLLNAGLEASPSTPERFAEIIKADTVRISKLIKDVGLR
jgi:tripartite-type tricarboxylate transporter receptor subunit TctC